MTPNSAFRYEDDLLRFRDQNGTVWQEMESLKNVRAIGNNIIMPNGGIYLRDTDIGMFSRENGYLDLFANRGVRIGDSSSGNPSNYSEFEPNGTLRFRGNSTVWDDLRIVPGAFQFAGAADPTLSAWQPGGAGATHQVYKFQKNDEVFASCQMPHKYREGTDVRFHIHWTPCDRGNEESGNNVGWKVDYSWANIDGTFASSATVDLSDACTGTDDYHEMTSDVLVSGTNRTISSVFQLRIYRSDTGTDDTWASGLAAQSPALLEFDIHFQIDTVGSRQSLVK